MSEAREQPAGRRTTKVGISRRGTLVAMRVSVKLFAALREQAGARERTLDVPDDATVGDVWSALALGDDPAGRFYPLHRPYAARTAVLRGGGEGAGRPPHSGGPV